MQYNARHLLILANLLLFGGFMNNKKISILGLCFLCFFILFSCNKEANGKMQGLEQEIVLREEGGDFGYPNPFRHQNRGPGFFKMELIYDSL